jgi:hypothetical protein
MVSKTNEKIDLIYDLVKENRQQLNDFRKEAKEDHDEAQKRLFNIESASAIQNQHLAEHMRRTDILEKLHAENQTRIEKLEEPKIALITIKKWFIGISAVVSAIVAVVKLLWKA